MAEAGDARKDAVAGPAFVIHGFPHLTAVLEAAGTRSVTVITAPGASAYAGPSWFAALIEAGRQSHPDSPLTAILDCGDRAGDALSALALGIRSIVFTGPPEALARLRAIADLQEAVILDGRPDAIDLINVKNPAAEAQKRF